MNAISLMAADPAAGGSMSATLITFVLIILIFYFLIIRPQKKRDKEAKAMIDAMKKGDKVVTIGGIHGTIVAVRDQTVVVKVDDSARIEFSKSAISTVSSKDKVNASAQKKDDKNAKAEEVKKDGPVLEMVGPESEEKKTPETEEKEDK